MSKPRRTSARTFKKRVFLVEDHPVTREGFAQLINYQPDLQVCGQAGTAAKAIAGIVSLRPDLAIIDISLAESNGIELIKQAKALLGTMPVLVLSTHDEALYAERALRAGARGYVMKQAPTSEVMSAIRKVLGGDLYLSEAMRTRLVHEHLHGTATIRGTDIDNLSDRELEIFELIGHGQTTGRIAVELVRRAVEWVNRTT